MEDSPEDSEQGLTYGEEASSEDDSKDISNAPDETKTSKGFLD